MQVGRLRHLITLQSRVEAQDPDTGVMSVTWQDFSTGIWASVEPLSAREFITSQVTQAQITTRILIRYRAGVEPKMRVLHRDKVYAIEGVLPDRESGLEYLTLACSSSDNESGE
jgi:SPP1 family predicted phage head-tail adaptor